MQTTKAPGKHYREGVSLIDLFDMFPNEKKSVEWFESVVWPEDRVCPHCGSTHTIKSSHKKMPYWCSDCRSYFSVKTGTPISNSNVPMQKWCIAIYLCLTSLKSVSSMKLHRDIKVTQKTAWFMLHRIREAWMQDDDYTFGGPVEVDETYFGGKRSNMSNSKREELKDTGRGSIGKTAVVGIKDRETNEVRAKVVANPDKETLHPFIAENVDEDAMVYTDDATVYDSLPYDHEAVKHSVKEYVRDQAHTNGVESFWATLKRAHKGTFHKISPKHLNRYVHEFAGKHNIRDLDTLAQMRDTVARMVGRNLLRNRLTADNGLSSMARS